MRLTKGQLKQIIREEYSRLKRQGLITESFIGADSFDKPDINPEGQQVDWEDLEWYPYHDISNTDVEPALTIQQDQKTGQWRINAHYWSGLNISHLRFDSPAEAANEADEYGIRGDIYYGPYDR